MIVMSHHGVDGVPTAHDLKRRRAVLRPSKIVMRERLQRIKQSAASGLANDASGRKGTWRQQRRAIASSRALDIPSDRDGNTNTSMLDRKAVLSDERPRNEMRLSLKDRVRKASAHGLSISPAITSSTSACVPNLMNASTRRSVPLTGLTVPRVPNLRSL
jgi:hypothetical protein